MNRRFYYLLLMFVIIISISGIGQAAEGIAGVNDSTGVKNRTTVPGVEGDRKVQANFTVEQAGIFLHDLLEGSVDTGPIIKPTSLNPYVEIVGYADPTDGSFYYVKRGDTLYKIAKENSTSIKKLRELNNLRNDYLYVGQKLLLPSSVNQLTYYVKAGDSLYKLAEKYNVSISRIKETNNLQHNYLYVGQKLIIPMEKVETHYTYHVKAGDSLYTIASKFDSSIQEIKRVNNLQSNYLYIGQTLNIPMDVVKEGYGKRLVLNSYEMDLLARAVYSEARGEPYNGQVAIAAVIINRVLHPLFPDSIEGVIFQPWQFTAVHDGQFWLKPNQQAYRAAGDALDGWDPTGGAIYYYNPKTASSRWVFYRKVIIRIGQHYFAI